MNTAILIPGMLRCFEEVQVEFKKYILEPLNADVFFSGHPNKKGIDYCEEKIKEFWNPKKYNLCEYTQELRKEIHPNDTKFESRKRPESGIASTLSGKYNIKIANKLRKEYEKESNIKYDLLMVWRPELIFYRTPSEEEIEQALEGKVLIPNAWDFKEVGVECISDIGVLTNSESMDIYCSLIDRIENYWENGCMFHPETLMGVHIKETGLERVEVDYTGWYLYYNKTDRKGF